MRAVRLRKLFLTRVSAVPVRERILLLRERGIPTTRLAEMLGYHINTLNYIVNGRSVTTRREIADDVYSVKIPPRRTPQETPNVHRS